MEIFSSVIQVEVSFCELTNSSSWFAFRVTHKQ